MKARANLTAILMFFLVVITPAQAEYPVIDTTAIGKLTEQLNKAMEQIKLLTDMNAKLQAQINAIGAMGQITLPIINAARIASRVKQDLQCLKPDLSKLMPNISFDELQWNSICQANASYQQTLFVNPDDLLKLPSWGDRKAVLDAAAERRQNVVEDAATKGLAQGDVAAQDVEHLNKAADDLESSVTSAVNQNDRLAAIAQGQVIMARAMAQQNQILAQLLKVQSAYAIAAGVTVRSRQVEATDKGKPNNQQGGTP